MTQDCGLAYLATEWQESDQTNKSDTETGDGGEAGTLQSTYSSYKKGHMTNIYLTDSEEETL